MGVSDIWNNFGFRRRWAVWRLLSGAVLLGVLCLPCQAADAPATMPATAASVSMTPSKADVAAAISYSPPYWSAVPFAVMLLLIAVMPLIPACEKFWHRNSNKLLVSLLLSIPVMLYYWLLHPARPAAVNGQTYLLPQGLSVLRYVMHGAIMDEYVPFIVLLLSLYTISGGIELRGDIPAHPRTNALFLVIGSIVANFIGTTGAAMLLIRPLLNINSERRHVKHTVIFFIFVVCNVGGCLLPIGDPPLFLGYLQGVPFLWTLTLAKEWAVCTAVLLLVYFVWDCIAYRREDKADLQKDESHAEGLHLRGKRNFFYLLGVVLAVGFIVPGKSFLGMFVMPNYVREGVLLALTAMSMITTPREIRQSNQFSFSAIGEVAALFIGIFVTMQAPIEILQKNGAALGINSPVEYFWASGMLSSFLDNAPTYMVFFETANSLTHAPGPGVLPLVTGEFMRADLLTAISLGSVFMGANTYIGNGPNFMVKAIAEERGVKMPGFFGYMLYSVCILMPIFILLTFVFFVWKLI